ncbi:MAG: nuclease-related domain-containing protein [Woeseiaceae bacterium]
MSELFLIIKEFYFSHPDAVTWGIASCLVVFGIMVQKKFITELIKEKSLNNLLKNMAVDSLHNIKMSDGMDGSIFIEHLLLCKNKIILLSVKRYQGVIFAADKIDFWTQVLGKKSYKFDNPLLQLENTTQFLNSKVEGSRIEQKVLFIKGSEFPKGKPEDVLSIEDVKEWKSNSETTDVQAQLKKDWSILFELAESELNNDDEVLIKEDKTLSLNVLSLLFFLTLFVAWLVWRL